MAVPFIQDDDVTELSLFDVRPLVFYDNICHFQQMDFVVQKKAFNATDLPARHESAFGANCNGFCPPRLPVVHCTDRAQDQPEGNDFPSIQREENFEKDLISVRVELPPEFGDHKSDVMEKFVEDEKVHEYPTSCERDTFISLLSVQDQNLPSLILDNWKLIIEELDITCLYKAMQSEEILGIEDFGEIISHKNEDDQKETLIRKLLERGPRECDNFLQALKDNKHRLLASKIFSRFGKCLKEEAVCAPDLPTVSENAFEPNFNGCCLPQPPCCYCSDNDVPYKDRQEHQFEGDDLPTVQCEGNFEEDLISVCVDLPSEFGEQEFEVVEKFVEDEKVNEHPTCSAKDTFINLLSVEDQTLPSLILCNWKLIVEELDITCLHEAMKSEKLLGVEDFDDIISHKNEDDQKETLIRKLLERGPRECDNFLQALKDNKHRLLASKIFSRFGKCLKENTQIHIKLRSAVRCLLDKPYLAEPYFLTRLQNNHIISKDTLDAINSCSTTIRKMVILLEKVLEGNDVSRHGFVRALEECSSRELAETVRKTELVDNAQTKQERETEERMFGNLDVHFLNNVRFSDLLQNQGFSKLLTGNDWADIFEETNRRRQQEMMVVKIHRLGHSAMSDLITALKGAGYDAAATAAMKQKAEEQNYFTLLELLYTRGLSTLQDVFCQQMEQQMVKRSSFSDELSRLKDRKILTHKEIKLLLSSPFEPQKHMDINLICKLLQNIKVFNLSYDEKKGVRTLHRIRNYIFNAPRTSLDNGNFLQQIQDATDAILRLTHRYHVQSGKELQTSKIRTEHGDVHAESESFNFQYQNVLKLLLNEGTKALRDLVVDKTTGNLTSFLKAHQKQLRALFKKNAIHKSHRLSLVQTGLEHMDISVLAMLLKSFCVLSSSELKEIRALQTRRGKLVHLADLRISDADADVHFCGLKRCIQSLRQFCRPEKKDNSLPDTNLCRYNKEKSSNSTKILETNEHRVERTTKDNVGFQSIIKNDRSSTKKSPQCSQSVHREPCSCRQMPSPQQKTNGENSTGCGLSPVEEFAVNAVRESQVESEHQLENGSEESETEVLDAYFARIARCSGSEPIRGSEQQNTKKIDGDSIRPNQQVLNEKDRILSLLHNTSIEHVQKQKGQKVGFMAIQVTIPEARILVTREQIVTEDKEEDSNLDGELNGTLFEVKRLPSNRLPWPLLDMDIIVAQGQNCQLDDIFKQMITVNPPGPQITMKYEILRLCTYRHFPDGNKPYAIRLAGAGFYYAGKEDELTCYCCGLRRTGWSSEDIPVLFHERASPGCSFVKKIPGVNIPVLQPPDTRPNRLAIFDVLQESGASEQATASASALVLPETTTNSLITESAKKVAETSQKAVVRPTERLRGNMAHLTTLHPLQQHTLNPSHTAVSSHNEAMIQRSGLGIDYERPKHPQYSVKAVRLQSYQNWPRNVRQTPHELAEAGMYYAGFGDCVRCFFCGIGLRHWSDEDNPWIEHARWSSRCVFLRQVKGDEFVDLVQLAVQYSNEEEDIPGNLPSSSTSETVVRQEPPKDNTPNYLLTDAAQSVLEMGYQPRMVQKAIDLVLKQKGREHLTASSIMERVIVLEEADAESKLQRNMETLNLNSSDSNTDHSQMTPVRSGVEQKETDKMVDTKKILQQNKELKEQTLCKICLDNPVCIVFLPCGHLVTCAECAPAMRKCPICRANVKGTVKTYMA